jgi:hypothetical protein
MNNLKFTKGSKTGLGLVIAGVFLRGVLAQSSANYTDNWSTVAGGGGTCSAGQFNLCGTIGQAAPGTTATRNEFLSSGFWATDAVGPALLHVVRSSGNAIITWTSDVGGWTLQSSDNLGPKAVWTAVAATIVQNGNQFSVSLPVANAGHFFRLVH